MLQRLCEKPAAVIIVIIFIFGFGVYQFSLLPIALYPRTAKPEVMARISTNGMTSEEFRGRFGQSIERNLAAIAAVSQVKGEYDDNRASFEVEFEWGVEADDAKQKVLDTVEAQSGQFPDSFGRFRVDFKGQYSSRFFVSVKSQDIPASTLSSLVKSNIVPSLEGIAGIADVWLVDWSNKTVTITLDPTKLETMGVTYADVRAALNAREYDVSLGSISSDSGETYRLIASIKPESLDALNTIPISSVSGQIHNLRELATIGFEEQTPDFIFKTNGEKSLLIGGYAEPDANIRHVSEAFIQTVQSGINAIDPKTEVKVIMNPAEFINEAVGNVFSAVLAGMAIATLIVFLFLGSLRNTFIVCVSIPLSLVGGFILMRALDIELNLISLGAMALAVGMVVDGSIVVLENIYRHLENSPPNNFLDRIKIILKAAGEVRLAVVASLLTTIIVFAPLPFTAPLASAVLGDLATVMVCVMAVSVVVTLLFIPPLVALFRVSPNLSLAKPKGGVYILPNIFNGFFRFCTAAYQGTLATLLERKIIRFAAGALILFAMGLGGYLLVNDVEREIMARPNTDKLFVHVEVQDEGMKLSDREIILANIEKKVLRKFSGDITHTLSQVGENNGWVLLFLDDKQKITRLKKEVEEFLVNTPLVQYYINDWTPTALKLPNPPMIKLTVAGENREDRLEILSQIEEMMRGHESIGRRESLPSTRKSDEISLNFNDQRLRSFAADNKQSIDSVRSLILNSVASLSRDENLFWIKLGDQDYGIRLKFPDDYATSPEVVGNQLIRFGDRLFPVRSLSDVKFEQKWSSIFSRDGQIEASMALWPKDSKKKDKKTLAAGIKKSITEKFPGGKITFQDTEVEINENINSLVTALLMSLALILIVITVQFGSVVDAVIMMLAIPLGFIGVSFSLWLFSSSLGINSMLGLILLGGTAVNNSILFLDFYNRVRQERPDSTVNEWLLETARLRLRPIMITTMTTILGMFPIALGLGSGGEILQPLGIAICGGLWLSALLTLLVVPLAIKMREQCKEAILGSAVYSKMFGAAVKAGVVLLSVGALPFNNTASAKSLTITDAVELAIATSPEIKSAELGRAKSIADYRKILGSLLPTLAVGREWSYSNLHFDQSNTAGVPEGDYRSLSAVNYLVIREKISNPAQLHYELRAAKLGIKISEYELSDIQNNIKTVVMAQYYRALLSQKLLENSIKNSELIKASLITAERRFKSGFISKTDFLRSKLTRSRVNAALAKARYSKTYELNQLKKLLPSQDSIELSGVFNVPKSFLYFELSSEQLEKISAKFQRDYKGMIAQSEYEQSLDNYKKSQWGFLPSLSFEAKYDLMEPMPAKEKGQSLNRPLMSLGLEWELFSGGRTYYDYQVARAAKLHQTTKLKNVAVATTVDVANFASNLASLKTRYLTQYQSYETASEIADSSRRLFEKGGVDSSTMNEDVISSIAEADALVLLALDIISTALDFSKSAGDVSLFNKLVTN